MIVVYPAVDIRDWINLKLLTGNLLIFHFGKSALQEGLRLVLCLISSPDSAERRALQDFQ